ncbi:MAG: hypothetical protein Q7K45_01050 [Nanoarchaeota archaeon]|nr:hypothetical protein [Nanoarchaeota archaeon]
MAEKLPSLELLVQTVVGQRLKERDFPAQLSTRTVREFHVEVHAAYFQQGRADKFPQGTIKKAVRCYLEKKYDYVQEYADNPLQPGKRMITGAYYERKIEV